MEWEAGTVSQRRNFIKIVEPVKGSEQRKVKLRFVF